MKRKLYFLLGVVSISFLVSCGSGDKKIGESFERKEPSKELAAGMEKFFAADEEADDVTLHSIMVVQHGKVLAEKWMGDAAPDIPHVMYSVSKTFTSVAAGLAIEAGLLSLDDKMISFFPNDLPEEVGENLAGITVRDLLTMTCGHDVDHTGQLRRDDPENPKTWVQKFLEYPVEHTPGTFFCYNSVGTYMVSAIVQKVTGEKVFDYLKPRLFDPLNITDISWEESPEGINCGGWGLFLKTEDMAKFGQLLLQGGQWNGKQLIPAEWVKEMSSRQVDCCPAGMRLENCEAIGLTPENSDWRQGYGYQMWRCRNNGFRADGANGQYILVFPEKDAVIIMTANSRNLQKELTIAYDNILSVL